jgi:hypothetical protein
MATDPRRWRMSKNTEVLRTQHKVFNNHGILQRWGGPNSRCVEYHMASGRGGYHATVCWSVIDESGEQRSKEFFGTMGVSMRPALEFAKRISGEDFVKSPFGGFLPKSVVEKMEHDVKNGVVQS